MEKLPVTGEIVAADKLPNHRLHYLDYEGDVSGDRGHVRQTDAGVYDLVEENASAIVVSLCGENLRGVLTLHQDDKEPHRWRISFSPG
jgi:hypothetical protein